MVQVGLPGREKMLVRRKAESPERHERGQKLQDGREVTPCSIMLININELI